MPTVETERLQFMRRRLDALRSRRLYRQLRVVRGGAEPYTEIDGRRLLNLSSNNYLGLADHLEVRAAVATAGIQVAGSGSSRLIAGTSPLHQTLEERLARFKGVESALLFNSGYTANVGIIPALVGPGDVVLGDELNHASLIDGCRLSRAEYKTYPHRDTTSLEEQLVAAVESNLRGRRLVVTDTVFSMDGDLAPLATIAALCDRYNAMLLVDEAHATGCVGPGGRGLVAQLGLRGRVTASMSTLSKALGSFGAFVAADSLVTDYLINVSRTFIFSTALPPAVVAASLAAVHVLEREPELVQRLQINGSFFRRGLRQLGFDTLTSETHIVPILVGDSAKALRMAEGLQEEGILAVAIRPPTVPMGTARIRASLMATHAEADLQYALAAFAKVGELLDLI